MTSKPPADLVLIYSTFPDKQSAKKISRELIAHKLAACANIFSGMSSVYNWQDELQQDEEIAVIFKTTKERQQELSSRLAQLHPYDTPAIIGFDASYVEATYHSWLQTQTKRQPE